MSIGEKPEEPVFTIADLLPHLSRKTQSEKKVSDAFEGEKLNVLVGSLPFGDDEVAERFKLGVLEHLHANYGFIEEDLMSAELEVVPAGEARDIGWDRGLVGGYGQDDRSCAFTSAKAIGEVEAPTRTAVALFLDKEEVGSTGAKSRFLEDLVSQLLCKSGLDATGRNLRDCLMRTKALSADVAGALDPDYQEVHEKRNAARIGYGVCITKFTGSGGKYGSSDANAEYLSEIRSLFNRHKIVWHLFFVMATALSVLWLSALPCLCASPLDRIGPRDTLLVVASDGHVLFKKNETEKFVPASTLKILTAVTALNRLGLSFRFKTDFYLDDGHNLTVKGYGDPLLISEAWEEMAGTLDVPNGWLNDVILDDSYFARGVDIPGSGTSTNPYDAPLGALCANFNTVFFGRDSGGGIVSAEPQTPLTPLAFRRVRQLGLERGRYTFTHEHDEIVQYAGEILVHFLRRRGIDVRGKIRTGIAPPKEPLCTYRSPFALEEALQKMLAFSNNFLANQILMAMGAQEEGPPATLEKGVSVLSRYAKDTLHLKDIQLVEGSGISRGNRLSAVDMLAILQAFQPYRHILTRDGDILYKSGTLRGLRTRAGYIERPGLGPYYFVVSLTSTLDMNAVMDALKKSVCSRPPTEYKSR